MGNSEKLAPSNIVTFTCSACHINIIYIKVINPETNNAPFKSKDYTCSECNQGLMQTIVKQQAI